MSEPFLSEIRMVGFNFAPRGWAFCDGQILPINQNQSLYSLIGTTYGGDGRTSFALPDLRGRTPMHIGNNHPQGQKSGAETVALSQAQMPQHKHTVMASTDNATTTDPNGNMLARSRENLYHAYGAPLVNQGASTLAPVGVNQGHENMQPWLAVNFCIALQGLFPSRN